MAVQLCCWEQRWVTLLKFPNERSLQLWLLVPGCRPHFQPTNDSWRVDETYIKVKGEDKYLYRAIETEGQRQPPLPPNGTAIRREAEPSRVRQFPTEGNHTVETGLTTPPFASRRGADVASLHLWTFYSQPRGTHSSAKRFLRKTLLAAHTQSPRVINDG